MDTVHPRCAGLDVHKKTVVASARLLAPDGRTESVTRTFGTMTADLLELADWLAGLGVTVAAMEATGVYWQPVWHILEGRVELMLVNARHIKQVPGRKTDVKDAEWIAQLLQHGLLSPSFVPPPAIRELRDLTRQRAQLVRQRARVANRLEKVLESANIKLTAVASDVLGASGRAMIGRLVAGESDPDRLAAEARGSLRSKAAALRPALRGRVTEHHRFQLGMLMEQVGHLDRQVGRYSDRIAEVMGRAAGASAGPDAPAPGPGPSGPGAGPPTPREAACRLATIPGVGERSAEAIVAEIGADMGRFATAGHLASWAGLCPGNDISAGRRRSGRTTKGSVWLRTTLVQVAWAASHTKATALSAAYRRWARRLGRKKALVALAHKILRLIYTLLKGGRDYDERLPRVEAA
jgi:transposase